MSFQVKNNRNAAKRIYNLSSLNNPIILQILNSHKGKFSDDLKQMNLDGSNKADNKNSLLSITGKQVVGQNAFNRSTYKEKSRNNTEMVKKVKEIRMIL